MVDLSENFGKSQK